MYPQKWLRFRGLLKTRHSRNDGLDLAIETVQVSVKPSNPLDFQHNTRVQGSPMGFIHAGPEPDPKPAE